MISEVPEETLKEASQSVKKKEKEEKLLKQYQEERSRFYITLEVTAGCGERGQQYIDEAYARLKAIWTRMSTETQKKTTLPVVPDCNDDGMFGAAYGVASLLRS